MNRQEAIAKIRKWDFLNDEEKETLESVIPELKKSKDEVIRESLINFVKTNSALHFGFYNDEKLKNCDILDWLEKYNKPKPVEYDGDDEIKKMLINIVNTTPATIAVNNRESLIDWIERHDYIKNNKWDKEDEGMLNCVIATLCEEEHGGRETNDRLVTWLESRRLFYQCDHCKIKKSANGWKPTKGQMDAMIWEIKNTSEGSWQRTAMEKLYEDLKKL